MLPVGSIATRFFAARVCKFCAVLHPAVGGMPLHEHMYACRVPWFDCALVRAFTCALTSPKTSSQKCVTSCVKPKATESTPMAMAHEIVCSKAMMTRPSSKA